MSKENRRYKRLSANWIVKVRAATATAEEMNQIKDISLGGVFIETRYPFEIGTLIEFEFQVPGAPESLVAKGIVRWSNDGKLAGQPLGMGVEFVELASKSKETIRRIIDQEGKEIIKNPLGALTASPLHIHVLRFFTLHKPGENYDIDVLKDFLQTDRDSLLQTLGDFQAVGLVEYSSTSAKFLPIKSSKLKEEIAKYLSEH